MRSGFRTLSDRGRTMRAILKASAVVAAMVLSAGGSAHAAAPLITDGLLGYWSFDDQADMGKDDSGNSHDGVLYGGPAWEPAGQVGGAISLDGTDDYVDIGPVGVSGNAPRTIAGWAKAGRLPAGWEFVFGFLNPTDVVPMQWWSISTRDFGLYYLQLWGDDTVVSSFSLQWQHFVASHDGTTTNVYVDGVLQVPPELSPNTYDHLASSFAISEGCGRCC
jgi:hypothetical protein